MMENWSYADYLLLFFFAMLLAIVNLFMPYPIIYWLLTGVGLAHLIDKWKQSSQRNKTDKVKK